MEQQRIRMCRSRDRVALAWAAIGSGPPLLRAAHWLSHLEHDWHSPVWRPWLVGLARAHTLIRYDPRGCGLSDWDVEDVSFDRWVEDLETVADAAGLDRFPLLAPCQGGAIAIAYAVRHPERVTRLILYGAYSRGRRRRGAEAREEADLMLAMIRVGWGRANPAFREVFSSLFLPDGTPEQRRWFTDLQRLSTSPANAARLREVSYDIDVTDLAARLRVPTLILHSEHDAVSPFSEARHLAALIPGARLVPLASRNHILLETEPAWTRFIDEVHSFLGVSTPAPRASADPCPSPATLTDRERDVLALIAEGATNAAIAERLSIRQKTVENHITRVFRKLGVERRAEAIVRALSTGFGGSPAPRQVPAPGGGIPPRR